MVPPQIAIRVRKVSATEPINMPQPMLVGGVHVEPAAGVPDQVPHAAERVIPQAQTDSAMTRSPRKEVMMPSTVAK
jgi:hypothetical protein